MVATIKLKKHLSKAHEVMLRKQELLKASLDPPLFKKHS